MRLKLVSAFGLWLAGTTWALAQPTGAPPAAAVTAPPGVPVLTTALDPPPAAAITAGGNGSAGNGAGGNCAGGCAEGLNSRCISLDPAQRSRAFFSAEYLLWWIQNNRLPPLVQVIPTQTANLPTFQAGLAQTLFPDEGEVRFGAFSGFRLHGGLFFDDCKDVGIDGSFFWLPEKKDSLHIASAGLTGDPAIGIPFANTQTRAFTFLRISSPNEASGAVAISDSSRLWGFDINGRAQGPSLLSQYFDVIAGFRYLDLEEKLGLDTTTTRLLDGSTVSSSESFKVRNQFYGGQVGGHAHYCCCNVTLDVIGKLALGDMHEQVNIDGVTRGAFPGLPPVVVPGGIFAQPRNIGDFERNKVCFIPELTVNVGYQVSEYARVFIGYNLLWISNAIRLSSIVDTVSDPAEIPFFKPATFTPATARPVPFQFDRLATELWVQGINFGVALRY
jgi:hypothetical protein